MYSIKISNQAKKDLQLVQQSNLKENVKNLLEILEQDPYRPPYEKLRFNLNGLYSRRINRQHRLVYRINEKDKIVTIMSMWSHYE